MLPAYIGWPRGGGRGGAIGTSKKNFVAGGGRTLLFTLVSESVVRILKFAKMTKFLFLAQGYVWVEGKKVCAKLESTSRRGGGGEVAILWPRSSPYSTTLGT